MSTYTGSAFATKYAAYLIYKGSATAAALNISQPKIGYVYDITEGGTLTPGNITVQQGDAVVYLAQGWTHCNNGGADQAIANLSSQFNKLLEEIGETDFSKFALKTELPTVPTNVSAFTNDAGYLTQHQSLANYALKTEIPDVSNLAPYSAIPQNVSQLTNDAHYLTEAVLNDRVRKVDDLAQDTDAADGEIVQLTTDGRFYRFTEPQAEGESGTWTVVNQPADIASGDNFLTITNNELGASIDIAYNSSNQHLELKGKNSAVVSYVDMSQFIVDGMLDNVQLYTTAEQGVTVEVPYLKFTFNVASGKSVICVSLKDLVDIYDGSNINLTSAFVKAAQYSAPAIGDSMDVAIGKLLKGHEDNATAIAGKQNTLTFDDAPTANSNNPVKSQGIKAAIDAAVGNVPNALKQKDLTTYQGTDGEIVQHTGATTAEFVNGYVYKSEATETIPSGTVYYEVPEAHGVPAGTYYETSERTETSIDMMLQRYDVVSGDSSVIYNSSYLSILQVGDVVWDSSGHLHTITQKELITITLDNGTVLRNGGASGGSDKAVILLNPQSPTTPLYKVSTMSSYLGTIRNGYLYCDGLGSKFDTPYGTTTKPITIGGWQRINVQPSSEGAVSDLETRMTAAETAISGKQPTITGAASTITTANLTASKALVSDASGKVAESSVTATELGYLSGATANIQQQLNGKQATLTFDDAPMTGGNNPVKSGGIKTAIDFAPRFYIGTCSTAGNVAIKQVDIPNFPTQLVNGVETPIVGSVIAVKYQYASETTSSQRYLKVNNTNAYPFWYDTAEYSSTSSNATVFGLANKHVYYLFNGTHWVWIGHGNDNDSQYSPPTLGFGYGYCNTAAATTAKVASLTSYALRLGSLVVVYFENDVPANATLNINNQGVKEIHFGSSRITSGVIKAGDKCLFIYNGNYMLIAIDRWGKELQEKVSGINISETDFEALSTFETGKLYFVYDDNNNS